MRRRVAGLVILAMSAAGCTSTGAAEAELSGLPGAMAEVKKTSATATSFGFGDQAAIDRLADDGADTSRLAGLADQRYPAADGEDSLFDSPLHQALGRCLGDGVIAARFGASRTVSDVELYATGVRVSESGGPIEVWCTAIRNGKDAQAVSGRIAERVTAAEALTDPAVSVLVDSNIVEVTARPASNAAPVGVFLTALDTGDLDNLTKP